MRSPPLYFYFLVLGGSFILSAVLTPIVRRIAIASGRVAVPKDDRWHRKETALLGGVSMFGAMTTAWVVAVWIMGWSVYGHPVLPIMLGAGAMFGLGLADDLVNMDPQHKLAGQIVIASILMFFGFRLGWTDSKTIGLFLSILWIVGITNAFNLLDNMDGLAAGIAFIAGSSLFIFNYLNPEALRLTGSALLLCAAYLFSGL